jgi:hypothetical protein
MIRQLADWVGKLVACAINRVAIITRFVVVYRFGAAIGEHVAMTAAVRHLAKNLEFRVIVLTNHDWVYHNNPRVFWCSTLWFLPSVIRKYGLAFLSRYQQSRLLEFKLRIPKESSFASEMRTDRGRDQKHLIEIQTENWPTEFQPNECQPEIFFSKKELTKFKDSLPMEENYGLIQSEGKKSFTPNKDWGWSRFQEVVNKTKGRINWIQVGSSNDTRLNGCLDMCGKLSFRQLAFIFEKARFGLFQEGMFTHLAAALRLETLTIYTGFMSPSISAYENNHAIVPDKVDCAPCWLLSSCPNAMACIKSVTPQKVAAKTLNTFID